MMASCAIEGIKGKEWDSIAILLGLELRLGLALLFDLHWELTAISIGIVIASQLDLLKLKREKS